MLNNNNNVNLTNNWLNIDNFDLIKHYKLKILKFIMTFALNYW